MKRLFVSVAVVASLYVILAYVVLPAAWTRL